MRRRDVALDDRALAAAVADGQLSRVRRGWYATPGTDLALVRAVGAGGQLACVSALRARGVWTMPHAMHVSFPRGTPPSGSRIVTHTGPLHPSLVEPAVDAFRRFAGCGTPLEIIVAADSAIQRGVLTRADVARVLGRTARGRRLLDRVDGAAESGLESIARVRLRSRGLRLRTQVLLASYRVDILIGDRLIVELDGERWHDTASSFEADRRRDAALTAAGFVVMRFTFRRVMDDWPAVEREILTLVRRDEHRRRGRHVARSD
jgi:very-short-patch-repair endonuclease